MWTRYHIKCRSCEKTTNLRLQIPEVKELPIKYNCLGCKTEIKAILKVDFEKATWDFNVERGELIEGNFLSGDFFHEYSDTLPIKKPSTEKHNIVLPTLRMPTKKLMELKDVKDNRKMFSPEEWSDFKDLTLAYSDFNKDIIAKLSKSLLGNIAPKELFEFKIDLDYQRIYFVSLNYFVFPWIDFDNHTEFVFWLLEDVFNESNKTNTELIDFVQNITTDEYINRLRNEISGIINRFNELKEYFQYAYDTTDIEDSYVSAEGFNELKNFYTDCFEFIGRNSHLIFRLQNIKERGAQDSIPAGCPRDVTNASDFMTIDNGRKLEIINLSTDLPPKKVYCNSFDNKIRNGINHFKAKLDLENQIISYYPITKRPNEEFQISYIDFLNKTMDVFNSVLKIGQVSKFVNNFKSMMKGEIK